jgi:hypothetical protein
MKTVFPHCWVLMIVVVAIAAGCSNSKQVAPPASVNPSADTPHTSLTITLYDKPLDTIRAYLQGKWQCHYGKGGIIYNLVRTYTDYYSSFLNNDRIIQLFNGNITTDTTINWLWTKGVRISSDSTFLMTFYDKRGYPYGYVIDGIFSDTLMLHENGFDGVSYYFTKSN